MRARFGDCPDDRGAFFRFQLLEFLLQAREALGGHWELLHGSTSLASFRPGYADRK
jgi:hypothetical protein